MKTTKKHFELFKKECQKWIDEFELNNWEVNFCHADLGEGVGANCRTDVRGYVSDIRLATDIGEEQIANIKMFAKHEVVHLLLARLSEQAKCRYINEAEITEAEEELVRKLTKII